jgi:Uma2 family endonuclease
MAQPARRFYSFGEYLAVEEMSPLVKHEFVDGTIVAMAGGTPDHSAIAVNVQGILREQLAGKRCRVFNSDLRVRVKATGLGTYPDGAIVCGALELDPDDPKGHTVTNPTVLVEVLSPTTWEYDVGEKRENYQQIETLQEIVFVAHDARRIDVVRREGGSWKKHTFVEGAAILASLGCTLPIEAVYLDPLAG